MTIRDANEGDFEQITAIYNDIVATSTAIYNDRAATVDDRIQWWRNRTGQGYPFLVAVDGEKVAGFGTFGDFRPWPGYRFTVEGTIHMHSSTRGQGVGTQVLKALVAKAGELGKHTMIAGVDAENEASLRFLQRFGFERAGTLREVGFKFGRFLDLVFLQYRIPPPPA